MLKKVSTLGTVLNKSEQKTINGGGHSELERCSQDSDCRIHWFCYGTVCVLTAEHSD